MTMGSLNAAQLSDEVGIYLLHMISLEFLDIKEGIYRGDAPFLVKNITSIGKSKKLFKFFKRFGLTVSILNEQNSANFFDTNFNLVTGLYEP